MEDTFKIRKDKIKNIAIIFLSVMLVLTFFSNSILNYSLPEVATQYVEYGTISEKVRGTGTVVADDPYNVVVKDTRVIESVVVKQGDEVEKDQILFVLEDEDSEELKAAELKLQELTLGYAQKILSGDISNTAFQNALTNNDMTIEQYRARIQAAVDKVNAAQTKVNNLANDLNNIDRELAALNNAVVDVSGETNNLATANANLLSAEREYNLAQIESLKYASVSDNEPDEMEKKKAADERFEAAKVRKEECQYAVDVAKAALDNKNSQTTSDTAAKKAELTRRRSEVEINKTAADTELTNATKEQTQVVADVQAELALDSQNTQIADQREEVEELREKAIGATITAPVAGTITRISKTAGESTVPEETLATIQVAGKGFTVTFSVTNAQAAKVKVGDVAELQNAWYYDDVKVTLAGIKTDTEDPGKKKQLVFNIEGNVQDGESLSIALGQRSASYDKVVPNSAVREDKNGKFILIIEEKSTPFGNRYKAKKVDVEVLASDDTKSAIEGELQGYEYVITTSNKPVEAGEQVRLAEN